MATTALARSFWRHASADGLLPDDLNTATLALATDVLICADTTVHLRRAHGWSAPIDRTLIVTTLQALTTKPNRVVERRLCAWAPAVVGWALLRVADVLRAFS